FVAHGLLAAAALSRSFWAIHSRDLYLEVARHGPLQPGPRFRPERPGDLDRAGKHRYRLGPSPTPRYGALTASTAEERHHGGAEHGVRGDATRRGVRARAAPVHRRTDPQIRCRARQSAPDLRAASRRALSGGG